MAEGRPGPRTSQEGSTRVFMKGVPCSQPLLESVSQQTPERGADSMF